jgi:serine/threonine protein phosphatase PrpC
MTAKTRLVIGFKDDVGLERDNMEDAAGYSMTATNMDVRRKGSIFVVADGVGGHQAGEVASKRAVNAILKEYYACPYEDTETSLRFAINQANDSIFKEAQETGRDTMATTVVCVVIREGVLTLANVGDSRIYILRSGKIRQLTEDHSWVNEQIRQGLLTSEEAKANPYRNVITRSLGNKPKVEADIFTAGSLVDNDLLILCSDGMYEGVSEPEMVEVTQRLPSVQAAEELVDMAKKGGSTDNITVMIVESHLTGDAEGNPVPMEVQKPATNEPRTRPNPLMESIQQMDELVEKPEEPPIQLTAEAPTSAFIIKEEEPRAKNSDLDAGNLSQRVETQRSANHRAGFIDPPVMPQPGFQPEITNRVTENTSQPSAVKRFRPSERESDIDLLETNASNRHFYRNWVVEYQSTGKPEPFFKENIIILPDGTEVTVALKISNSHFVNSITKTNYKHPLAFVLSANIHQNEQNHIKSKLVMGVGFYNLAREHKGLVDFTGTNYELLISNEEIFLINKTNPLIFATMELVEFENKRDHKVDQDFLTFLQIKARFHIIL